MLYVEHSLLRNDTVITRILSSYTLNFPTSAAKFPIAPLFFCVISLTSCTALLICTAPDAISFMLSVMMRVRLSSFCISFATPSPPFSISSEPDCTSTVTVLMLLIAVSTSRLPFSCSRIASVRRALISFTCSARVKIALNFSSTVLDEAERVSISPLNVFSVAVIAFPCVEESSASLRISSATTAKPLPASPA